MKQKVKKPFWKKWWFWVLVIFVVGGIGASAGGGDPAPSQQALSRTESGGTAAKPAETETTEEPEVMYTVCTVGELMDLLEANALKAKNTYEDQYVELSGTLNVIDSDGKYISLRSAENEYAIIGVQCYLQTDAQKEQVTEMSIGDSVVVRGQITDIGEVLGYTLKVDEFM